MFCCFQAPQQYDAVVPGLLFWDFLCFFFSFFFLSDLPTQYQEMHIISKKKGDALVYKQIDNYYSTVTQHQIKL